MLSLEKKVGSAEGGSAYVGKETLNKIFPLTKKNLLGIFDMKSINNRQKKNVEIKREYKKIIIPQKNLKQDKKVRPKKS